LAELRCTRTSSIQGRSSCKSNALAPDTAFPVLTSNRNIIGLTIAPVFFTAAMYLTLSRIIRHYGVHNSFLSPGWYTGIFMSADVISLVAQSVGGAIADMSTTTTGSNKGVHIMVAGLAFQIVSMTFFSLLVGAFFLRVRKDLARQRATNWAAGKVDPPTAHVRGYSTFVWSILGLPHLTFPMLTV
jgi:hypothetical protein